MKPHPLIGKVLLYIGREYLVTQAPAKLGFHAYQVYTGSYVITVVKQDTHYVQVASPGENYRPLTLKDLEP